MLGELPVATAVDLEDALRARSRVSSLWRRKTAIERATVLHKAAGILRSRADAIAQVVTAELGAPLAAAKFEVMVASDVLDWSAGEARRIYGRIIPSRFPGTRQLAVSEPIGPVFAACPWNMPVIFSDAKDRRGAGGRLLDHHQAGRGDARSAVAVVKALEPRLVCRAASSIWCSACLIASRGTCWPRA